MVQTAKLTADLVANTSRFEEGMRRASRTVNDSQKSWSTALKKAEGSFDSLQGKIAGFAGSLVAGLGLGKFLSDLKKSVDFMDEINKASQRIGTSTEVLSKLAYGAKLANVSFEDLETSLKKFQINLADVAGDDGKKAQLALKNLGLNVKELIDLQPDQQLEKIADGFANIENPIVRSATAAALFGKNGTIMLNLLKDGSEGLREFYREAEQAGVVIDQSLAEKAEKLNDDLTRLDQLYQGFLISLSQTGAIDKAIELIEKLTYGVTHLSERLNDLGAGFRLIFDTKGGLAGLSQHSLEEELASAAGNRGKSNPLFDGEKYFKQVQDEVNKRATQKVNAKEGVNNLASLLFGINDVDKAAADFKAKVDDLAKKYAPKVKHTATGNGSAFDKGGGGKTDEEKADDIIAGLRKESEEAKLQVQLYNDKTGALQRARKELDINNQLARQGITLTAEQREQVELYLDQIENQSAAYEQLQKQQKEQEEATQRQQRLLDDLGNSFSSAFEDAIINGKKLSEVLQSLLEDILKLLIRTQFTQPLVSGLGKAFGTPSIGGGGLFGGLFGGGSSAADTAFMSHFDGGGVSSGIGSWFADLFSFDSGTSYVPHDMIAKLHEGEEVVPATRAASKRNRGSDFTVNVINNNGSKVSQSSKEDDNGVSLSVMIDEAVANNISKKGSRTNQALSAVSNQGLIRR